MTNKLYNITFFLFPNSIHINIDFLNNQNDKQEIKKGEK